MITLRQRFLLLIPAGVSLAVVFWFTDPDQPLFADVRLRLLSALAPIAVDFYISSDLLPFLLYPVVALNIFAPVLVIAYFWHLRDLRNHMAGRPSVLGRWPVITNRFLEDQIETVYCQATKPSRPARWCWLFLAISLGFALSLWCRDVVRQQAADEFVVYTVMLELLLVIVWSRMVWWWLRALLRSWFFSHNATVYLPGGWLLEPGIDL